MNTFRRQILTNIFKLFDVVLLFASFDLAALLHSYHRGVPASAWFPMPDNKVGSLMLIASLFLIWHLLLKASGLYRSHRLSTQWDEVGDVTKGTFLGMLGLFVAGGLSRSSLITPLFLAAFWIISTLLAVLTRMALRAFLGRVRMHGRNLRRVVVVGTNQRAISFALKLEARAELGYRVIGFVDEDWAGIEEFRKTGLAWACHLDDFTDFLRKTVVDEVVIGLPMRSSYVHASKIAVACAEQGILVRMLPGIFDLKMARSRAEELDGDRVITLYTGTVDGWPFMVKRIFDFVVSLALLVLLAPLFAICAILIKSTSEGPVFFRQSRVGLNKRRFGMVKFRTMVVDAEDKLAEIEHLNEVSGPVFKIRNDPRITGIGKFLRKTSIDELPQLLNVLTGHMSLVGPRPLPVRDYEGFDQDWQRRRFSVRPGITCLWQVNGRSEVSFDRWMELDLEYVDKWSLWLDLKILVLTVPAVLKGSGAA
jgi:exopolysaccharide biosynthesis polyprenyl glycosylphosphotransferase